MRTHESIGARFSSGDREHLVVFEHLATWEERSLLTREQVEAIERFEDEEERSRAPHTPSSGGMPLITEVAAYLGAALAVGAIVALVGPRWDEISHGVKLLGAAAIAIVLTVAGAFLRDAVEPAFRRLAGVLWTLALCAMTGFLALVFFDLAPGEDPAPWSIFAIGMAVGLAARLMQLMLPSSLLMLALFGGTVTAVLGAGDWGIESGWTWLEEFAAWPAIAILVVSVAFLVAGAREVLTPRAPAMALGAIGAVIAPSFAVDPEGFGLGLGVGVAIALLAGSVWQASTPMLIAGAIGLFRYLVGAIVYFLSDTVGVPVALLLSGGVLLGVAVATARLKRFTGRMDGGASG